MCNLRVIIGSWQLLCYFYFSYHTGIHWYLVAFRTNVYMCYDLYDSRLFVTQGDTSTISPYLLPAWFSQPS